MTGAAFDPVAEARVTTPGADPAVEPRAVSRRRVVVYAGLAGIALLPAAVLRVVGAEALPAWLSSLAPSLDDIRFGSGMRFWLGVAGAAMMALLLLYPLRKVLAHRFRLGSVGGWLHLHVLLGLAGPVLVLYHANLGTGGFNANVALATMLIVTVSGIVGHLVHAPASAAFHAAAADAARRRMGLVDALLLVDGMGLSKATLITELERYEAELLAPRRGILATVRDLWCVSSEHVERLAEARWLIEQAAAPERTGAGVEIALVSYFTTLRSACARSLADQLLARWRLFHLPVFLVMIAATSLHVVAVWDVDAMRASTGAPAGAVAAVAPPEPSQVETASPEAVPAPRIVVPPVRIVRVVEAPAAKAVVPAPAGSVQAPVQSKQPVIPNAARFAPPKSRVRAPAPVSTPAVPPPQPAASEKVDAGKAVGPEPAHVELKRLTEAPMGLGGAKGATLADRIKELKAIRFDHAKTRFPLTGRHVRVACESCHTKSLEGTPRDCIACHREDDIHRGRRPDCARCHTTNRWSEIVRRR